MRFKKLLSAAMALAVAGSMAATASAELVIPEDPDPGVICDTNSWFVLLYSVGNEANDEILAMDYGIDYSKVAKLSVTFTVSEEDRIFWDGAVGGAFALSINGGDIPIYETDENGNPVYKTDEDGNIVYETDYVRDENGEIVEDENGEPIKDFVLDENGEKIPVKKIHPLFEKYNFSLQGWWGVTDEALGLDEAVSDKDVVAEKVGDYTYRLTTDEYDNPLANGDAENIGVMQIIFADWGFFSVCRLEITSLDVMDGGDNVLISFDSNGKATVAKPSEPDTSEPDTSEPDTSEPDTSDDTSSTPSTSDTSDTSSSTSDNTSSTPESSDSTSDNTSGTSDKTVEFVPAAGVDETVDEETAKVIAEIKVSAPEAAFEAGTTLTVKKDDSVDAENAFALDITFTLNGAAVQPKDGAAVTVSVPVPPKFKDVSEDMLKVFHYLNGKYTRVEATVQNGTVTFDTTHFSTYVISPDDLTADNPPESSTVTPESSNPSTGVAAVSVLPLAALTGAILFIAKKKK